MMSLNKIVVGHLIINSIRNKFDFPAQQVNLRNKKSALGR